MTGSVLERTIAPERAPKRTFRPDVQGLRAVAVVAVIVNHIAGWPSGGFAGVDVFFVISGFLITGLLLREHDRTGTISFLGFYKRRAKRILPAGLLVIALTVGVSFALFTTQRAAQVLQDGIWATFFAANWHFVLLGTDYFHANDALSPLQHYWSLGVEEQFYLVWPWLMLAIFAVTRGRLLRQRIVVGAVLVLLTGASFVWSIIETNSAPTSAYFSTLSRAWELGLGALIAVAAPLMPDLRPWLRTALSWLGVLTIGVSLFVITATTAWPAPFAALPVAGSAIVIIAGIGADPRYAWVLTNPVSVWLGDLSYSLYVWHFPIVVLLTTVFLPDSVAYFAVAVIAILVCSTLSYYLLEDRVRSGRFAWSDAIARSRWRQRARPWTRTQRWAAGLIVVAQLAWLVVAIPMVLERRAQTEAQLAADAGTSSVASVPQVDGASEVQLTGIQAKVASALNATAWPTLNPSVDQLGPNAFAPEWVQGCVDVTEAKLAKCTWGDPASKKVAVVLGDSVAASWLTAVRKALQPQGYTVRSLTMSQCPAADVAVLPETSIVGFAAKCSAHNAWAREQIASLKPSIVIASSIDNTIRRLADKASGADAENEWARGVEAQLGPAVKAGAKVYVLQSPPTGTPLQKCYTRLNSPSACVAQRTDDTPLTTASRTAATKIKATFVDTYSWFCYDGSCPAFVAGMPVYVDGAHLTGAYSAYLGSEMRAALS